MNNMFIIIFLIIICRQITVYYGYNTMYLLLVISEFTLRVIGGTVDEEAVEHLIRTIISELL